MASFLFDVTELESFRCSTKHSHQKLCTKPPVYSSALCNNIFVRIWIFLSTSFEKQV